ncbi:uncharacterized protein RHIMIDRAFT_63675 [Rhizopus microsporus ATCC 52813]|uniref:Uncharacterized protein n=1 Tax=Rhizopus microsporus ATCC 52813 TaxID=1340429 RepID=A0A2G4T6D0_RHIZD|nr:uncharacterized protein RHIMIDRAFT_63675 [Rhizopus microsporus ATCC 52813]PHZ16574.1 hypothetical protein RHIMIDRAFT_63675 [Rhizopus microsporus ATCC 52813]
MLRLFFCRSCLLQQKCSFRKLLVLGTTSVVSIGRRSVLLNNTYKGFVSVCRERDVERQERQTEVIRRPCF